MPAAMDFFTGDMVRALNVREHRHWPRYETVHGELLVSPAPRMLHQVVVDNLHVALHTYLQHEPVGRAFTSPADISWGLADVCVQPDVFVVPPDAVRTLEWGQIRHLLLAAEVMSPRSVRADRFTKRRLHQEQGTPHYWVIDVEAHAVELWAPESRFPRLERELLTWHPSGASSPFLLALDDLFQAI